MTVSDVYGNFLQLGHNTSEPEDARAVMLVNSLHIFLYVRPHYTKLIFIHAYMQGLEALHGAGLLVWLVLLRAEQ